METRTAAAPRTEAPPTTLTEEEHGGTYWFFHKIGGRAGAFAKRHWILFALIVVGSALVLLALRAVVHPAIIALRVRSFLVVLAVPFFWILWRRIFRGTMRQRLMWAGITVPLVWFAAVWGDEVHEYVALWRRYNTAVKLDLEHLPTTDHERIQPLNSIYSLSHEAIGDNDKPQIPDFVRVGGEYRWSVGVEPAYYLPRMLAGVREILSIAGTAPSPNFTRDKPVSVNFPTGERLLFGRNSFTATIRTFGPWRYWNYEPADVVYITDDQGAWIQVVSLIRWVGIFFPRPEFGGVQIIRQQEETFVGDLTMLLFGSGEWVPSHEVSQRPYLRGQNILPYRVSRYIADSFRFKDGFLGPMPGYHRGDVRIPDLEADVNPQPFTIHVNMPGREGALYHFFGLEPIDVDKQGLSVSLFIPGDGSGPVYFYDHNRRGEALFGVSAVSTKVKDSRKDYKWEDFLPVEHRPLIWEIDGETRFFWLTTVVTRKKEVTGEKQFIAGAVPELVITDAIHNVPVWVNPNRPDTWANQLRDQLGSVWKPVARPKP